MRHDEIDGWLSDDDPIVPSSGFAEGVMEAVRREALDPRAIPFPWMRALPGIVAIVVALAASVAFSLPALSAASGPASTGAVARTIVAVATNPATAWLAVATLLTVAPLMWSLRLMRPY
jgi:hypothetical protein